VEEAYANYLRQKSSTETSDMPEQEEYLRYKELQSTIQEGISQLPPQQQRAFKLSREEGLSHDQISQLMGVSKKTVKDYIVRSIAFLRPYLKHYSGLLILIFNNYE
jgi:RNA polymerase sigma-70 factor (ECF subfamily)